MTETDEISRLIRLWVGDAITSGEFLSQAMAHLWTLPLAERRAAIDALSAHQNEGVRDVAADLSTFMRHEALSKDLDYVRRNSPLQPGVRLYLFGGYDYYSTEGKPWWLNGREFYRATFLGFATYGEDTIPAALVEFDAAIDLGGHKGRYGVLLTSYSSASFAWGEAEDVAAVYVAEALPDDMAIIRTWRASGSAIETHASYRVEDAAPNPNSVP